MTEKKVKKTVSHSEVESYLRCELAHFYGYGMEIQRRGTSDALGRGIMGHKILDPYHNTILEGGSYQDAYQAAKAELTDLLVTEPTAPELLNPVIPPLTYYMTEWFPAQGFTILAAEKDFVLEVSEELATPVIPDLIVRDRWDRVGVFDSKFTYDFYTDKDTALMPQLPKYMAALRGKGLPADWAGYLLFRYRGKKDDTAADRFRMERVDVTGARIQNTFTEQVVASERIQDFKRLPLPEWRGKILRTFNQKVCQSCQFYSLCATELNNPQNAQAVLDSEYMKRERREFTNG